jgi:hypothetical protein
MILGTAAYMAPEQAKGRPVDRRADIWAFGCVVYEMITGRPAFDGDDVSDTLANILKVEPDWAALPSDTPQALRRLLRRCLSKDLSGRLSDIGGARLEIADASSPAQDAETVSITVPKDSATRSRWRDATLVAAGLSIAGGGFLVATYFRAATPAAATVRFGVAPVPGTRYPDQAIRAAISVSPDGRFLAVVREHKTRQSVFSTSADEGATWSPIRPTAFKGSNIKLFRLRSGQVVCVYRDEDPAQRGVSVSLTGDGGESWTSLGQLYAAGPESLHEPGSVCGYPDLVALGGNEIGAVLHPYPDADGIQLQWFRLRDDS